MHNPDPGRHDTPRVLLVTDRTENDPVWDHILRQQGLIALLERPNAGALKRWAPEGFDVVVVDAGKTARATLRLGRAVKEHTASPLILCLPAFHEQNILDAYAAGIQEVVFHPLNPPILLAKILAWARHGGNGYRDGRKPLRVGRHSLNANRRCLIDPGGKEILLTSLEFRLLQLLMSRPGHIFKVEVIVRSIWGGHGQNDQVLLKNVVYRLRRKIETDPRRPALVHTWPEGYSFQG